MSSPVWRPSEFILALVAGPMPWNLPVNRFEARSHLHYAYLSDFTSIIRYRGGVPIGADWDPGLSPAFSANSVTCNINRWGSHFGAYLQSRSRRGAAGLNRAQKHEPGNRANRRAT